MPTIQSDNISTVPYSLQMAAGQAEVLSIDMALALLDGESFSTATATLRNLGTGELDEDLPEPTVDGTAILQAIDGDVIGFAKGETYELVVYAVVSATRRSGRRCYIEVVA